MGNEKEKYTLNLLFKYSLIAYKVKKNIEWLFHCYVCCSQMQTQSTRSSAGCRARAVMNNSDLPIRIEKLNLETKCNIYS